MKILEVTLECEQPGKIGLRVKGALLMSEIEGILPTLDGQHSLVYTQLFPNGLQVVEKPDDLYPQWWTELEAMADPVVEDFDEDAEE